MTGCNQQAALTSHVIEAIRGPTRYFRVVGAMEQWIAFTALASGT